MMPNKIDCLDEKEIRVAKYIDNCENKQNLGQETKPGLSDEFKVLTNSKSVVFAYGSSPDNHNKKIIEVDLRKIIGIDEEEKDKSVGYYQPFCIVGENENKEQVQIFLDWDDLIALGLKIKPYLESYESECKMEAEMFKNE